MKTSKDPRHQARRLALSLIYSYVNDNHPADIASENPDLIETTMSVLEIDNYDKGLVDVILKGVTNDYNRLIKIIAENSDDWDIGNIYKIDLSALLMATWEITNTSTPIKVIIDEAVELAKEFGESESAKFINGILAGVNKQYATR